MSRIAPESAPRVLIICQDNIGDLVFTSSLAEAMLGTAYVAVLSRDDTVQVARLLPGAMRVHTAPSLTAINPLLHGARWRAFRLLVREIKQERYDAAILVGKNWRLGWLAKWAGVPLRVGYAYPKLKRFLTHVARVPDRQQAVVPALMTLLDAQGHATRSEHYALDAAKVAAARARSESAVGDKWNAGGPWVGLHAFAGSPTRCVALETWLAFANWLTLTGKQVIWFGVSKELQRLRDMSDVPGWYCDDLGDGSLDSTIGLLSLCRGYVGHDSGVLHIASASGLRTLGVFAPGEPARTFAQGPGGGETLYRPSPSDIDAETLRHAFESCFPGLPDTRNFAATPPQRTLGS